MRPELEGFWLAQALDGLDYGPEALAELVGEVTKEQVVAVAKSVVYDLIYFLRGREDGEAKEDEADDELFEELSERYKPVRNCVDRIADYILINYHYDLSMDERLYLLIHIQRVTKRYVRKKKPAEHRETEGEE